MAPTSDERREVAERLRENADKRGVVLDYLGSSQVQSWWLLLHTIGCESDEQEDVLNMLADLIDPTCHMTREFAETELGRVFQGWLCDECMCTADVLDASEPPSYCPNCGARVVDDGSE